MAGAGERFESMNIQQYLARLEVASEGSPSLDHLSFLHERHMLRVPFENLDIHRGVEIVLDEDRILKKIVEETRGGFCYELNTAFAWLLRCVGYKVSLLAAEVVRKEGGFGIPFDHMTLGVEIPGQGEPYLADVGFGDSFRFPFPLVAGQMVEQLGEWFRLVRDGSWWLLERRSVGEGDFHSLYRFTGPERKLSDFAPGCRYHQRSPRSSFTRGTICTRALADGRITLHPDRLVSMRNGVKTEKPVAHRDEWMKILSEDFDIVFQPEASRL